MLCFFYSLPSKAASAALYFLKQHSQNLKKFQKICRSAHVRLEKTAYNSVEQEWVGVTIPFCLYQNIERR